MLKHSRFTLLLTALAVVGCQTTGEEYQADVFDASQVNTRQRARTVKIITVTPTRIKLSHEGALAGAMVKDSALVPGVLIGYSENGQIFTSAQVGRACQFSTNAESQG